MKNILKGLFFNNLSATVIPSQPVNQVRWERHAASLLIVAIINLILTLKYEVFMRSVSNFPVFLNTAISDSIMDVVSLPQDGK